MNLSILKPVGLALLLALLIQGLSCAPVENENEKYRKYPEDSELSLLMRRMFEEGMAAKARIEKGQDPDFDSHEEALLSYTSTDPATAESPTYKSFANVYLSAVKDLGKKQDVTMVSQFNSVVDRCMDCHRSLCPGPMVRIEKMYLD